MARDPVDRNIIRLESRRYVTKCETQIALVRRADTLREISRLALLPLPYSLTEDYGSRDAQNSVRTAAEDRARELITDQIANYLRAEPVAREKFRRLVMDGWSNLTGPLGHLRGWAQSKLLAAEQIVKLG